MIVTYDPAAWPRSHSATYRSLVPVWAASSVGVDGPAAASPL